MSLPVVSEPAGFFSSSRTQLGCFVYVLWLVRDWQNEGRQYRSVASESMTVVELSVCRRLVSRRPTKWRLTEERLVWNSKKRETVVRVVIQLASDDGVCCDRTHDHILIEQPWLQHNDPIRHFFIFFHWLELLTVVHFHNTKSWSSSSLRQNERETISRFGKKGSSNRIYRSQRIDEEL